VQRTVPLASADTIRRHTSHTAVLATARYRKTADSQPTAEEAAATTIDWNLKGRYDSARIIRCVRSERG
jgi:hypothetical protein